MGEWSVYILRTRLNSLYTGITIDIERRLAEHAGGGKRGAKSLRAKGPLKLVYEKQVGDRSLASQVECGIKKLSKADKEALIIDQPSALCLLELLSLLEDKETA